MKYILLIFFVLYFLICKEAKAQSNQIFQFPAGVDSSHCHSQVVVVKFRPTETSNSQNSLVNGVQIPLNQSLYQKLGSPNPESVFQNSISGYSMNDENTAINTPYSNIFYLSIPANISLVDAINLLRQDPSVEYAEPVYLHYPTDNNKTDRTLFTPNDPQLGNQYYLSTINAYTAWDINTGSSSIKIGIVDTGFELSHSDLTNRYVGGYDLGDNDTNLSGDLHGTEVSGVAAAQVNNSIGMAGLGYNCVFVPVKTSVGNSSTITYGFSGILYAAQQGCKVINISWGRTGAPSSFEQDYLRYIVDQYDVVLVAAAGNNNNADYFYPASYEDIVLSVGGSNSSDNKSVDSDFNDKIGIIAPGENIYTTTTGNNYTTTTGTSFAAPLVSAAAALLRNQFPALKASQIIARLKASSQTVLANTNYPNQLGRGRLDVYNALTATNLKSIDFERSYLIIATGSSQLSLICQWVNNLNALSNLSINLSCSSPYITISDNQSALGAISGGTRFDNRSDPFGIQISPSIPGNTSVGFTLTYTDGAFTYSKNFSMLLNPTNDFLNVGINQVLFSGGNKGIATNYNGSDPLRFGLSYKNYTMVTEAALMIGLSTSKVSNAARKDAVSFDQSFFSSLTPKYTSRSTSSFTETYTYYEDVTNNVNRIGVEVYQNIYAWKDTPNDKFVIVEYKIRNISGNSLTLNAGIFADWDIQNAFQNTADYDATNKLGYVYETGSGGLYGGIRLLSDQTANYYALDNNGSNGSVEINTDFTTAEKYQTLFNNTTRYQAGTSGGNDVSMVMSGQLLTIPNAESRTITFAFVVGDNLTELKNNAIAARNKFIAIKTSPTPVLSNQQVCNGTLYTLLPPNGNVFNFYNNLPAVSTNLLRKGRSLTLNNVTVDQTYYVSNVDSLYESSTTPITISVLNFQSSFSTSTDTLNLASGSNSITFQSTNQQSIAWNWTFGNGSTSTSSSSTQIFTNTGSYTVSLTSTNSSGCSSTTTKNIVVINQATTVVPVFSSFSPQSGSPFTQVSINGNNLDKVTGLFFGNISATFQKLSSTSIVATVPSNAVDGKITLYYNNGSVVSSSNFTVLPLVITATDPLSKAQVSSLFPNPARDKVFLQLDKMYNQVEVVFFNSTGLELKKDSFVSTNNKMIEIELDGLEGGLYFVRVNTDGKSHIYKLQIL